MSVDLRTPYLGLVLRNPLVAGASPVTGKSDSLRRVADAGVGAVVLPSLFEEQIEHDEMELARLLERGADSFAEATDYVPGFRAPAVGPEAYLRRIEEARRAVEIPVIASLNGMTTGGWVRYARRMEEAGAQAIELNVYFVPTDPRVESSEIEQRYVDLVGEVAGAINIPLSVKVGPFFTAFAAMAARLQRAGADGLVLFNRFVHPDIDLEELAIRPNLVLSSPHEMRLSMMWIAVLRGRVGMSLGAGTGVHSVDDVLKMLLVGADAVMLASSLLMHGPSHVSTLLTGLTLWMEDHEYESVEQLKGSMSQEHSPDPAAFERVNYMRTLASFTGGDD